VQFYHNAANDAFVPGLMRVQLGDYHIRDIEFSAAIDIDSNKTGKDLSEGPEFRIAPWHSYLLIVGCGQPSFSRGND
jgi:hypothetical protein